MAKDKIFKNTDYEGHFLRDNECLLLPLFTSVLE